MSAAGARNVLITGGTRGLGLALARAFLRQGCRVAVCGRDATALDRAARDLPGLAALRADVAVSAERTRLVAEAHDRLGSIDVLVNNAAICRVHDLLGESRGDQSVGAEIDTNLVAPIDLARLVLALREPAAGLTIANVSTAGALIPLTAIPLYSATKAALRAYTASMRRQLGGAGVKIVELFPPTMNTGLINEIEVAGAAKQGGAVIERFAAKAARGILNGQERVVADPSTHVALFLARAAPRLMAWAANASIRVRPAA